MDDTKKEIERDEGIKGTSKTVKEEYEYTIEEVIEPTKEEIHDSDRASAKVEDNSAQQGNGYGGTENQEQEHPKDETEKQYDYKVRFKLPNGTIIRERAGNTKDIPEGISLAGLAHALRKNGLNFELVMLDNNEVQQVDQLETKELSTKVIKPGTQYQDVIEAGDAKEEQKQLPGEVPKKRRMGCIPVMMLPLAVILVMSSIVYKYEYKLIEREEVQITISGDRNPGQEYGALGSYAGQEQMTNRFLKGDGKASYDMYEQADIEQRATEINAEYSETTETIKKVVGIINDENSTPDQKEQALDILEEQFGIRVEIREEVRDEINEMAEAFNEAAEAHPDSRTEEEEEIVAGIVNEFHRDTAAENTDLHELQDLNDRIQNGEEIGDIQITRNEYGDYVISAENVREVVVKEEYRGFEAIWQLIKNAFGNVTKIMGDIIKNEGDGR